MAFDLEVIIERMDSTEAYDELDNIFAEENFDPDDPRQLVELQAKLQRWSLVVELQAATVKSFTDTLKSVVQKY